MLTVAKKNQLVFDVKFSDNCVDYDKTDGGGETHITNGNRVAGNMYSLNVYG